jgi:hypothetical protein
MSEDEIKKAIEEIKKLRFRCRICGSFVIFPQCGKPFCPIQEMKAEWLKVFGC